jgi:hypothetical protein
MPNLSELLMPQLNQEVLLYTCEYIEINSNLRVYYALKDVNNFKAGFHFYSAELASVQGSAKNWVPEASEVSCLFWGISACDGVRHMYFGVDDGDHEFTGYLYCPDLADLKEALGVVQFLVSKYCS